MNMSSNREISQHLLDAQSTVCAAKSVCLESEDATQLLDEKMIRITQHWVDKAVVGLNLCPFAKAVQVRRQIRYIVSHAQSTEDLCADLAKELLLLANAKREQQETTLLIIEKILADFATFNDFLDTADAILHKLGLSGILQVADFHPDYQFAGTHAEDMENYTNRAPYPTLHLLREDSIDQAVAVFPDASSIYERNIERLNNLGRQGWDKLEIGVDTAEQCEKMKYSAESK